MRPSVSQLILDFDLPASARGEHSTLRVFNNEKEYFDSRSYSGPEYQVLLPHAFRMTALMEKDGWQQTPRPSDPARSLGVDMWWNLPEEIRKAILSGSDTNPQRVAILSRSCGIDDIPWEWLGTPQGELIAALPSVRFVRLVPKLYVLPPLTVSPPLSVLIVVTNPKDERWLNANEEIDIIREGLTNANHYRVEVLYEPKVEKLAAILSDFKPEIVHYVGHSGISGGLGNLILHDDADGTRWLPASEIAAMFPSSVRLVCLSTCVTQKNYQLGGLSKFAHCDSEISLPTTVVNQYALGKNGARVFWREFYPALCDIQGDVVEAFHNARMKVLAEDQDPWWCWASFSLVIRDGTGQPFRVAAATDKPKERFAAELQAQWSARLANDLATRMRGLGDDAQQHWAKTLEDETARIETFERDIESS
jgi:hypothetical protein